jgi:phosphatidate cytidylyltransferase
MRPVRTSDDRPAVAEPGRFGADVAIRTRSAVVLGLAALGLTAVGGWAFALFVAGLAGLVLSEWLFVTGCRRSMLLPGDLSVVAGLVALLYVAFGLWAALVGVAALIVLVVVADPKLDRGAGSRVWAGVGVLYAVLPAIALMSLRASPSNGLWALVFLYAVVWSTDIGAFFVGRALGGARLLPAISPKKTWSGAIGGLLGAVIAGLIVSLVAGVPAVAPVVALAGLTSIVCQSGDLFESWIKRCFLVKDSGQLIPGHGGVMDRVDGLIAASLFMAVVGWSRAGLDAAANGVLIW